MTQNIGAKGQVTLLQRPPHVCGLVAGPRHKIAHLLSSEILGTVGLSKGMARWKIYNDNKIRLIESSISLQT